MYGIWRRFPAHIRCAVVAARQTSATTGDDPLHTGLRLLGHEAWPEPRAVEVADALIGDETSPTWRVVLHEALTFIDAWDAEQITDLAAALGVSKPCSHTA